MSEGQVKGDRPIQLNYVIPSKLIDLLERYCRQTLASPSALIRRLISEFVGGSLSHIDFSEARKHPQGRRTTVVLPSRLLGAFEEKLEDRALGTKASVIAALLEDFLPPRVLSDSTVRVELEIPKDVFNRVYDLYGPGPSDEVVNKALQQFVRQAEPAKETT